MDDSQEDTENAINKHKKKSSESVYWAKSKAISYITTRGKERITPETWTVIEKEKNFK